MIVWHQLKIKPRFCKLILKINKAVTKKKAMQVNFISKFHKIAQTYLTQKIQEV